MDPVSELISFDSVSVFALAIRGVIKCVRCFKKKKKYIHVLVFFISFIYLNFEFQERSVSQCAWVTPKGWISVRRWHFEHSAYVTPHDM